MFEWKNRAVTAASVVRPPQKAGGPALIKADDGRYYFVKTNSETRRAASNEAAACSVAAALGLSTPLPRLVNMRPLPGALEQLGAAPDQVFAYGSQLPGDGTRIYDLMPRSLFNWVENLEEIVQWAAFDVWVSNGEGTQPVFSGALSKKATARSVRAVKISHACCFEGFEARTYQEAPAREIDRYQEAAPFDCTATVAAIQSLSAGELRAMLDYAPSQLLDESYRDRLLEGLLVRQAGLQELMARSFADALSMDGRAA